MSFAFFLARKYLISKKSANIINVITGISIAGLTLGTAAFILVLSVFNGFETLLFDLFSNFNPDIKVTATRGKTFTSDTLLMESISLVNGVNSIAGVLEETALFEYKNAKNFGTIKGVDTNYLKTSKLPSTLQHGSFQLQNEDTYLAVIGSGISFDLSIDVEDPFTPIQVYMPRKNARPTDPQPFKVSFLYPTAIFSFQQDFDNEYLITALPFVQSLLSEEGQLSALEIKVSEGFSADAVSRSIQNSIGPGYEVKTRYEQDESFYKIMNSEKWFAYAVMSMMLLLIGFATVGALWMFVLDKQKDIAVLKAMGASTTMIRNLFMLEGLLICSLGLVLGIILAIAIYLLQVEFGLLSVPDRFLVDAYPIELRMGDFVIVGLTVIALGLGTSLLPSIRATQVSVQIREE